MANETLEQKVQNYLDTQKPKHSVAWRTEIVRRINAIESNFPEQHIRPTHRDLFNEMIADGKNHVKKSFTEYSAERIEDIVFNALEYWTEKFDGDRGIEGYFLNEICIPKFISKDFVDESPSLGKEDAIDDSGNKILNKKGKTQRNVIRATTIRTDYIEKNTDSKEDDDERAINLNTNIETKIFQKADAQKDEEPNKPHKAFDILSREQKLMNAAEYDKVRLKTDKASKGKKKIKVDEDYDNKRMRATEILNRYYLLKDVAKYHGVHTNADYAKRFNPTQEFINEINNDSQWNGISTTTEYFKRRHSILMTATPRQFMELCINLLKKGVEVFDREISEGYFKKSDKNNTPILSAVAIDKHNNIISYCHKGQIVSANPQKERRSFQKHCEFTLLTEIINSVEDKERLKGGTLFVTLEPCNKRKFYCLNENCNSACKHDNVYVKVPCAVRCLEANLSKVYIGSYDTNPKVARKGEEILKSGCYTFDLKDGLFFSNEESTEEIEKDIRSQKLLEEDFVVKGYPLIENSQGKRVYRINSKIEVEYFPPDLIERVCELNGQFLANYEPGKYH